MRLFCTQRRVIEPVAQLVQLCFEFLRQSSLELVDLFRHSVCHGADGLSQNATLALYSLDLGIHSRELGGSVCALGLPFFADLSLVGGRVALEGPYRVVQFKYFLSEGEAFLLAHR